VHVVHVGWGFRPWRPGGLIAYAEDLMAAQVRCGHEVSYFLSGRHYPLLRRPRLKRWRRDGVTLHEVINGPIVFGGERGTRYPEHDLSDPWIEGCFEALLHERRPEVVHIQELAGLPSSLIELAKRADIPVLMTLQDYFPLCSTMRLYDSTGAVCLRRDIGEDCVTTNATAPGDAGPLIAQTLRFELQRAKSALPGVRRINFAPASPVVEPVLSKASRVSRSIRSSQLEEGAAFTSSRAELAAAYQRRRDVNLERLRQVDRLVAQSRRVAEIYRLLGIDAGNLQHVPLTVAHLEHLRPRAFNAPPRPVTFGTIDGCASPSKGVR
jgi:Glycosyl transferase 4-like domain